MDAMKFKIEIRSVDGTWKKGDHLYDTQAEAELAAKATTIPSDIPGGPDYCPERDARGAQPLSRTLKRN
jgi:hypothetical protein